MMHLAWLTRMLAVALLVVLVGLVRPAAQARQEATPPIDDAVVPDNALSATYAPFVDMPDRFIPTANQPLLGLLPGHRDAPAGLSLQNRSERTQEEVSAALGDPDRALQLLDAWGWSGNVFQDFALSDEGESDSGGMVFLNISLHRFADAEAADSALNYFSDYAATAIGLRDRDAPAIGESRRMLVGSPDGVPLTLIYVQRDEFLYRIGGSSADAAGDPTSDVLEVARWLMTTYDEATPAPAP